MSCLNIIARSVSSTGARAGTIWHDLFKSDNNFDQRDLLSFHVHHTLMQNTGKEGGNPTSTAESFHEDLNVNYCISSKNNWDSFQFNPHIMAVGGVDRNK